MKEIFKKVLLDINEMLGKIFYKSHSGFLACLKDHWKIMTDKNIKTEIWIPTPRSIDLGNFSIDEFPEARGGSEEFTTSYTLPEIPPFLKQIIRENYKEIQSYIGDDFLYESPLAFETKELPCWALNYDIYSNVWHMDSHDGMRFLKIFVTLSNVIDDQDGPFIYLERKYSKLRFAQVWHRWTFDNLRKGLPMAFPEEKKLLSPKGGYLIINTADCFHRASSPRNGHTRKMLQITLFPRWLAKDTEHRYPIKSVL